jgi:hypothetical protein
MLSHIEQRFWPGAAPASSDVRTMKKAISAQASEQSVLLAERFIALVIHLARWASGSKLGCDSR